MVRPVVPATLAAGEEPELPGGRLQVERDELVAETPNCKGSTAGAMIGRCKEMLLALEYVDAKFLLGEEFVRDFRNYRKMKEEECNIVMIPRERYKDDDCKEAKEVELKKLENFKSYSVVDDIGQYRISSTWVLWYKGEEVRARLVARGFEELEEVPSDTPTVDKCNMKLSVAIFEAEDWMPGTSDVKSAFLQGRKLDRTVVVQPPREANLPKGKL